MSRITYSAGFCLLMSVVTGCGLGPDHKLNLYVKSQAQAPSGSFLNGYSMNHRLPVGLIMINDTTGKESAPPMTQDSIAELTKQLSQQIETQFPFQVAQVIKNPPLPVDHTLPFARLGKEAGAEYLVVAILSSEEVESPEKLPIGGTNQGFGGVARGMLLGFETQNFSLAEIAFVEVTTGESLFQSSGQGYATLDRLMVPVESNVYPVVHAAQRQPPIFPEEKFQYDVLRSVSAHEAINQAMLHLKPVWSKPSVS